MGLNRIMHYPRKVISMKAKRNIILLIKRQESLYALGLFKTTQHSSGLFFFFNGDCEAGRSTADSSIGVFP